MGKVKQLWLWAKPYMPALAKFMVCLFLVKIFIVNPAIKDITKKFARFSGGGIDVGLDTSGIENELSAIDSELTYIGKILAQIDISLTK